MRRTDLTNRQFGKLHVLEFSGRDQQGHALWLCRCDCGRETVVAAWRLNSGKSQSCGCAISARAAADLELIRQYEPNVVKAAWAIFGDSYRYRALYNDYKSKRMAAIPTRVVPPDHYREKVQRILEGQT